MSEIPYNSALIVLAGLCVILFALLRFRPAVMKRLKLKLLGDYISLEGETHKPEARYDKTKSVKRAIDEKVLQFVSEFEILVEHSGGFENFLKKIPPQLWEIIDNVAYFHSKRFIEKNNLGKHSTVDGINLSRDSHHLLELLAFTLKVAWQRGYLMYKYHKCNHIPPPNEDVDPKKIWEALLAKEVDDLSVHIDVFMQRVVSFCTEEDKIRKPLLPFGKAFMRIMEKHLKDWPDTVRTAYGYGILASKMEEKVYGFE